jgi:DUF4097 and DUF4098 domain-containing protein YvlB
MKKSFVVFSIILVIVGIFLISIDHFNNITEKGTVHMEQNTKQFSNIDISALFQKVEIEASNDGKYGYEITSRENSKIIHEIKDSTLYITYRFYLLNFIFDIMHGRKNYSIKVFIPKDARLDAVKISNESGNISVKNTVSGKFDLKSTSGNISASAVNSENFKSVQTSGDLRITDMKSGSIETGSTSGKIYLTGCTAKNFKTSQTSGTLFIDGCRIDNFERDSTSGSFEIRKTDMQGLKSKSTSGTADFKGGLAGKSEIQTTSGDILLDITGKKQDYSIDCKISSGNIYIDGEKLAGKKEKQISPTSKNGNELNLKTTSGDIKLKFN